MTSFTADAIRADEEFDEEIEVQALAVCEAALHPASYFLPGDYLSRENFEVTIRSLNFKASPGYPYTAEYPSIGEWLGFDGFSFDAYQVERLWYDVNLIIQGDTEMILKGFIKMEPHKKAKIQAGRWRVIMGFPLNYQVLWKMVFDYGNRAMLQASYDIPTQFGLRLMGGDWKLYRKQWVHLGMNAGTDISAFDWCVTLRKMRRVYELRRRLAKGPHVGEWFKLASRLLDELFCNVKVLFPNGEIWQIVWPAVQKSGSPNTIADNSVLRLYEAVVVALTNGLSVYPLPRTVGDDALEKIDLSEDMVRILQEAYRRRGWRLKQVVSGVDFVGHTFTTHGPMPNYVGKHLWRFVHMPSEVLPEYLEGMARLYCHSPHYWVWDRLAAERGVKLMSQEYYQAWYDFEALTSLI